MKNLKSVLLLLSNAKIHCQTKKEYIHELFALMKQDSLIVHMGETVIRGILLQKDMLKKSRPELSNKSNENIDEILSANQRAEKITALMKKFVSEDLLDIYEKHFSIDVIKDYIQFYKTKSGVKFLAESPKIQNEIMAIIMQKYATPLKN